MDNFYMLQQLDSYITGNYGENRFTEEKSAGLYDEMTDIKYERMREEDFDGRNAFSI